MPFRSAAHVPVQVRVADLFNLLRNEPSESESEGCPVALIPCSISPGAVHAHMGSQSCSQVVEHVAPKKGDAKTVAGGAQKSCPVCKVAASTPAPR